MKRAFIACVLIAVLTSGATGVRAEAKWMLGFKGGVSITDLGGSDADSVATDSRTGFGGGLFAQADLTGSFAMRIEMLYTMKGASASEAGVDATVKLDYFEIPILLVGQVPASESVTLNAFAGPVLAFNTNAEVGVSTTVYGYPISGSVDIGDQIADFDFGLAFGAGATFDVGAVAIVVDGRYNLGLTTIDDSGSDSDVKNRGFVFMAGLGFPVGSTK